MNYIGLVEEPRPFKWRSGIEDLWLSPIERPKGLLKGKDIEIKIPSVEIPSIEIPEIEISI